MNTAAQVLPYEHASLLTRTPAIIAEPAWTSSQDWEDMRNYLERGLGEKRNWRTSWWTHWGEIAFNELPRRYHWLVTPNQMTRGGPINQHVVDSTPTQAISVCAAGMMDGLSSPTKRWIVFQPAIKGYEPDTEGKRWIKQLEARVYDVLAGSNYYDAKHQMYEDEIVFATAPMLIYEHPNTIINCVNPCAGEYFLACGADSQRHTFAREFTQTVQQIVERFGPRAVAGTDVAQLWNDKNSLGTERVVAHVIEPNFPANQYGQKPNLGVVPGGFAYREYYWLKGLGTPQPLSVRGFHEKPFQCPVWNQRSNDPYGIGSPGMNALPDVRQLHQMTRRHGEAVDKGVRPPQLADASLKNEPSSILPGRVTYVANLGTNPGMKPVYTVDPRYVEFLERTIERLQKRIETWFHNDVFMMISQMEGVQPRNELELTERRGEKLLRLGPVIERNLREDAIGINRIVAIMARRGLVPPKPASLARVPIEIKFVSKLAQIQQAADTGAMERTLAMAGRMEASMPGTLDNFNNDRFILTYGEKIEFPPEVFSTEKEKQQIRAGRAKAQQQQAAMQQMKELGPAVASSTKQLSETNTGGGMNALQMLLGGMQPTGAPQ